MSSSQPLIHSALHTKSRQTIIEQLWPGVLSCPIAESESCWDAYFTFYSRQCDAALIDEGKYMCARDHQGFVHLAQLLLCEPNKTTVWDKLRQNLVTQKSLEEENQMVNSSITVVRLLAMFSIGSLPTKYEVIALCCGKMDQWRIAYMTILCPRRISMLAVSCSNLTSQLESFNAWRVWRTFGPTIWPITCVWCMVTVKSVSSTIIPSFYRCSIRTGQISKQRRKQWLMDIQPIVSCRITPGDFRNVDASLSQQGPKGEAMVRRADHRQRTSRSKIQRGWRHEA